MEGWGADGTPGVPTSNPAARIVFTHRCSCSAWAERNPEYPRSSSGSDREDPLRGPSGPVDRVVPPLDALGGEAAVASWFDPLSPAEVATLVELLTKVLRGGEQDAPAGK
jgi:hypothetical protein